MRHHYSNLDNFLNLNVRGLSQSATPLINERSRQLKVESRYIYRPASGQFPFPVMASESLSQEYLNRYSGRTVEPVDKICDWPAVQAGKPKKASPVSL